MPITKLFMLFLITALPIVGCRANPDPHPAESEEAPMEESSKLDLQKAAPLVEGTNEFAVDLYLRLANESGDKNVFISPWSIATALQMVRLGAQGETLDQMTATLNITGVDDIDETIGAVQNDLNGADGDDFQLAVANRVWGREDLHIIEEYLALVANHYGAPLERLDFGGDPGGSADSINAWVSENTAGKIEEIVDKSLFSQATSLVLTNAIYFKGNWSRQFKEEHTKDDDFHLSDGTTAQVPVMFQKTKFAHAEGYGVRMLSLPYVGDRLSMIVLLPQGEVPLADVDAMLDSNLLDLVGYLEEKEVLVWLPKFRVETEYSLAKQLAAMGMPTAFGAADFSGITTSERISISEVLHKAFVEVNEEGTEAAAATAVIMTRSMAANARPVEFRVDRPFIFLIRDNVTGALLFIGRVMDPR